MDVLWEETRDGVWSGLTDNYLRVFTSGSVNEGQITPVRLERPGGDGIWGEIAWTTASSAESSAGTIPADVVYRDEHVTAFRDIQPQAPVHLLVIPNQHLASTDDLAEEHDELGGRLLRQPHTSPGRRASPRAATGWS